MRHSRTESGFTLVEVMVVGGLMSVLALGIATVMVRSQKQAQSITSKTDFNSLVNTLQGVFNNTSSCLQAFGGAAAPTLPAANTFDPPMTVSLNLGGSPLTVGRYGNTLNITKFELTGKSASGPTNQWIVPLNLVADRSQGGEAAVGGSTLSHTFNLIVTLDGSNKMIGCSGQFTNFWVATENPANITYLGGYVGVGTTAPGYELDVNGTIQGKVHFYNSDLRLKENVREIPDALERVLRLHGVMYDWRDRSHLPKGTDQLGLIAQDVEKIFPEVVITNPRTGMKSVAYGNLIAPLLEAVKEQQEMILKQQQEIDQLKKALKK